MIEGEDILIVRNKNHAKRGGGKVKFKIKKKKGQKEGKMGQERGNGKI